MQQVMTSLTAPTPMCTDQTLQEDLYRTPSNNNISVSSDKLNTDCLDEHLDNYDIEITKCQGLWQLQLILFVHLSHI